jgi:hypothetical protein
MFVNDQGVARVAQSRPFDSAAFCREWPRERVPPFECPCFIQFHPRSGKAAEAESGLRYGCDLLALSSFLNHQNLIGLDVLALVDFARGPAHF